jgi:MFS family permease
VITANIIGISWGTCIGWTSPAIAKMTDDLENSPLDFVPDADQLSWIGGFLPVGGLVGPILFAPFPSLIGRKWSLLLNALFFIASFLILIFSHDINSIYIARFLQGCGSGVVMVILPMYCGEIASAGCRGVLSSFIQIGLVGEWILKSLH